MMRALSIEERDVLFDAAAYAIAAKPGITDAEIATLVTAMVALKS